MFTLTLPSDAGQLLPEERIAILDNVPPSCAIDSDGNVFYLHFAAVRAMAGSAAMRVLHYPPGSVNGTEVPLGFYLNASGRFIQVNGELYVVGHHNVYPAGKKYTCVVWVKVPNVVGPCQVF